MRWPGYAGCGRCGAGLPTRRACLVFRTWILRSMSSSVPVAAAELRWNAMSPQVVGMVVTEQGSKRGSTGAPQPAEKAALHALLAARCDGTLLQIAGVTRHGDATADSSA